MSKHFYLALILSLVTNELVAGFDNQQLSFSVGSISTSYAESKSTLTTSTTSADTVIEPASGSASALPLAASWEYYVSPKRAYVVNASVPLVATSGDRYFFIGGGMNFYFYSISSKADYKDEVVDLKIVPIWRYYWGIDAGIGYLIYSTELQKKSDLVAELGGHLGIIYNINRNYGVKVEAGYSKGNGVVTSTSNIKLLIGMTYYLKD